MWDALTDKTNWIGIVAVAGTLGAIYLLIDGAVNGVEEDDEAARRRRLRGKSHIDDDPFLNMSKEEKARIQAMMDRFDDDY